MGLCHGPCAKNDPFLCQTVDPIESPLCYHRSFGSVETRIAHPLMLLENLLSAYHSHHLEHDAAADGGCEGGGQPSEDRVIFHEGLLQAPLSWWQDHAGEFEIKVITKALGFIGDCSCEHFHSAIAEPRRVAPDRRARGDVGV